MFRDLFERWQGANPADQIKRSWQGQRPDLLLRILDNPTALWGDDDVSRDIRRIPGLLENHVARLFNDGNRDEAALLKGQAQARYAALANDSRVPENLTGVFSRAQGELEDHFVTMLAPGTVQLEQQFETIQNHFGLPAAVVFIDYIHDDFGKSSRVQKQLASFAVQIAPALAEAGQRDLARRVLSDAYLWAQNPHQQTTISAMLGRLQPDVRHPAVAAAHV